MVTDETPISHSPHLPRQLNALVGRASEVAQLRQQLLNPACRLLTLLGPGGMGKTRLALEVATGLQDEFAAGVHFVNLQPLSDPAQLPTALADALHFPLSGSDPVESQLFRYLANKEMLLLLDNFEHLLASVDFLSELLIQSPGVKVLITSREVLNLQEEWLFPLSGLAFPPVGFEPQSLEQYAAATLFVERMRRLRPQLVLTEDAAAIGHICQLVEGMPLALELATSWTKTLSCVEIAIEIERSIEFLTTSLRNTPERHRSMLAVFEWSWQQLNSEEQAVFARLSVFRGGFRREAAAQVTGAALAQLSALVDKSLVRWDSSGRYQIHELLRQFGEEQLRQQAAEATAAQRRHANYFLHFLQQRFPDITGKRQLAACAEIRAELDNLRTAWFWAIEQNQLEALPVAAITLSQFYQIQCRFAEGVELFSAASQRLANAAPGDGRDLCLVMLQSMLGWLCIRLADLENAERAFQQGRQVALSNSTLFAPGVALDADLGLGVVALFRGASVQGTPLIEAVRESHEKHGEPYSRMIAWYWSARAQLGLQQLTSAHVAAHQALGLAESIGDRWFLAYIFDTLGHLADMQQDKALAQHYFARSYACHEEFGDRSGMALALNYMADVALRQQHYNQAQANFLQSLALHQQHLDYTGMTAALYGLGAVGLATHELDLARRYLAQALHISVQHKLLMLAPVILCRIGELFLKTGLIEQSIAPLRFILDSPITDFYHATRDPDASQRAQQLLDEAKALLPLARYQAACEQPQTDLLTLSQTLLAQLSTAAPADASASTTHHAHPSTPISLANAALIESLSERELEILHLIAAGHTNHAIAEKLILSPGTVKWYSSEIYGKLGVANRTQAVAEARRLKLIG